MTDLDVIIPFEPAVDITREAHALLELCLTGLALHTTELRFQATLVPVKPGIREQHIEAIRELGPTLDWRVVDYGRSEYSVTAPVLAAIASATAPWVAIVPPTHAIDDASWFGKLQTPFLRTPQCGLVFATDAPELAGTGAPPFPWNAREGAPGRLVLSNRDTFRAIAGAARLLDYPEALVWAAKGLGLLTWGVPGVRVSIAGAQAPRTRPEPRSAHRPG